MSGDLQVLTKSAVAARSASTDVAMSRQAQEVQVAMTVAKHFPRDLTMAYTKIIEACKRPALADAAIYSFPKGGTKVEGPSIRLAEAIAQNYGNLDSGIIELDQQDGMSTVMAYAWDLETNTRQVKVFDVPHERHTRQGVKHLTDPRDIYELVANQGSRRLRACILSVIPGDIIDGAVEQCNKTLAGASDGPVEDRVRGMVNAFKEVGVTQEQLEERMGHKLTACTHREVNDYAKILKAIADGFGDAASYFGGEDAAPKVSARDRKLAEAKEKGLYTPAMDEMTTAKAIADAMKKPPVETTATDTPPADTPPPPTEPEEPPATDEQAGVADILGDDEGPADTPPAGGDSEFGF